VSAPSLPPPELEEVEVVEVVVEVEEGAVGAAGPGERWWPWEVLLGIEGGLVGVGGFTGLLMVMAGG